jgi:hypothetical protein
VTQQAITAATTTTTTTTTEFHVSLRHTEYIKASEYSLLHGAARLYLRGVSTLTAEMCVPGLPGSPGNSRLV